MRQREMEAMEANARREREREGLEPDPEFDATEVLRLCTACGFKWPYPVCFQVSQSECNSCVRHREALERRVRMNAAPRHPPASVPGIRICRDPSRY